MRAAIRGDHDRAELKRDAARAAGSVDSVTADSVTASRVTATKSQATVRTLGSRLARFVSRGRPDT
jgi:hypothetical protein